MDVCHESLLFWGEPERGYWSHRHIINWIISCSGYNIWQNSNIDWWFFYNVWKWSHSWLAQLILLATATPNIALVLLLIIHKILNFPIDTVPSGDLYLKKGYQICVNYVYIEHLVSDAVKIYWCTDDIHTSLNRAMKQSESTSPNIKYLLIEFNLI